MANIKENLSMVLHKAGDLRVETTPLPENPGPDDVQLSTNFCGLCGTDIHMLHHAEIGEWVLKRPMIIGHEASATVVKVGSNVKDLKIGDNVTIEPAIPCGNCSWCRSGEYNYCEVCNKQAKGLPHFDGLLSRLYNHPAAFAHKLPEGMSLQVGALGEPMAVCVHSAKRVGLTVSQNVLVTGAGTMGLLSFKVAKAFGAAKVIVADINAARLEVAKEMGADFTFLLRKGDDPVAAGIKIKEMIGEQIDVTLECTGSEACTQIAVEATRRGGKISATGLGPQLIKVPLAMCSLKEIDILGICRFRNCFPLAVSLLNKMQTELKPIITHSFTLENGMEAFRTMERGEGVKVMVDCRPN
jgi:L-iditol 2-dehydrogenase